jgi:hypothetical protein
MMVVELADGWHMSTHAAALSLTGLAYLLARRLKSDRRFAFGPWKIEPLGGFGPDLRPVALLRRHEEIAHATIEVVASAKEDL